MHSFIRIAVIAGALQLAQLAVPAAEAAKTYQVTGPVLELNDKIIVVQKGEERWELARDAGTRIDGDLKVGSKVTVHYRMVAVKVESKAAKADTKTKAAK